MCTICLCILVHPVTLPCGHEMCLPCFKQSVEEASLTCPLCRTRISTWARRASRTNTLVDQKRWEQIQRLFPEKVQRRLNGLDDETDDEIQEKEDVDVSYRLMVQLSEPGEIRKEYEEELKRLQAQQAAERQREEEASASLIQRLHSLEEQAQLEARRQQEEIAARDAHLAQELGKLINTAESETPINRLLQESKTSYPNCPLPPSTTPLPSQDSRYKGKQPSIKPCNKTLETFFRRLTPAGKRSARCSSEPTTKVSRASEGKSGVGSATMSPRCQSAPVRDKENLPLVPHVSPLHAAEDLIEDTCFYEDLEVGRPSIKGRRSSKQDTEIGIIEEELVEIVDTDVVGQERTEVIDVEQERVQSASTVHSDGSDSVIVCEWQEETGDGQERKGDAQFTPIQSSPHTPPVTLKYPVPLEPCVVRITPRILFSTNCVSSTTFAVVPSPKVSTLAPSQSLVKAEGVTVRCADDPPESSDDNVSGADSKGQSGKLTATEDEDCVKRKLRPQKDKESISGNGGHGISDLPPYRHQGSRRARSSSPPTLSARPQGRLVSRNISDRRPYRRPSLKEFRSRRKPQSPIEEVVSDSELDSPSPRYRSRPCRLATNRRLRGATAGRKVESVVKSAWSGKQTTEEYSIVEGQGRQCLLASSHIVGQTVGSDHRGDVTVWPGAEEVHSVPSGCGAVESQTPALSARHGEDRPPAGNCSTSTTHTSWSGVADHAISGKGKRLLKRSVDGGLSHRNCPKSSRNASAGNRSEEEEGPFPATVSRERSKALRSSRNPKHTTSQEDHSYAGTVGRALPATAESVQTGMSGTPPGVCAQLSSDDSDRLVRRARRPARDRSHNSNSSDTAHNPDRAATVDRHQTKGGVPAGEQTSNSLPVTEKVGRKKAKSSAVVQRSESRGSQQKSIKHWFPSCHTGLSSQKAVLDNSQGEDPSREEAMRSEKCTFESVVSSTSSSAATSPNKMGMRLSQRARKLNPRLDDFLLTVTKKLTQFKSDYCTDSDGTPMPSPSKPHATCTTTPSESLQRKRDGGAQYRTPAKKSRKRSPAPSPQRQEECRPVEAVPSGQSPQSRGRGRQPGSGGTPLRKILPDMGAVGEDLTSEEDEEGLSQEERDRRLAVRLQQQFDLAHKLNLSIVRFKGTDDQYSLRSGRSHSTGCKE